MKSNSSLARIPENQIAVPSPLSPNKRAFNEAGPPMCAALGKKFRSEEEDLRVRVLGRNYSEGDIFRPMDHPGSHRRHSSPVTHREQPSKGALPPISQLVEPQSHHLSNELTYTPASHPHVMSAPVGIHPQSMNPYRSPNPGLHTSSSQGYGMARGGVPISFLHNSAAAQKRCESCNTSQSPEWRRGPTGHKTLCNACGLRYSRSIARAGKQQQKSTAANVSSAPSSNATHTIPNFVATPSSHSRQPITKSDTYIERTSAHHYPVTHLTYPRPAHVSSTLPSSSGNARGNR
ncbi:hypothetical protein K493DRAFT_41686 [Basidiobolus meristosporus CBS 931.73]|uniref:GATA-type domain-containing protein n=1 Tax=Basidiobolus meristosporus CBS 931.73 TaxID=1314790 RepID=A0A1Y1Y3V7_9FUNG|nr:hypothetical protein K493DRAFT_41686 [Basidiobolus meristosporus CBS 931.73]|eukprot:ORX92678.1 hypothetical protein K493DRAFT_41686 [Basidiobolus meristosporus CBS 931.73]